MQQSDQYTENFPIPPLSITGPSGVGKSTLINELKDIFPGKFEQKISTTSRQPRQNEVENVHYYFISKVKFEDMIQNKEFFEHDFHFGNYYGSSKQEFQRIYQNKKIPVLDIDINGPPSLEKLYERLKNRGTESEEKIKNRIDRADQEIQKAQNNPEIYSKKDIIINDDLEQAKIDFKNRVQELYKDFLQQ